MLSLRRDRERELRGLFSGEDVALYRDAPYTTLSLGTIAAVRAVGADNPPPTLPGKEAELEADTVAA